jgi:hypothetical protein
MPDAHFMLSIQINTTQEFAAVKTLKIFLLKTASAQPTVPTGERWPPC